ncbi:MAG: phospho-sugar mutase [Planctomycetota bacterium]|nr:phospho-sugar mutase [Planctomycetota bacterium]MDA1252782.1 phospho-sugar mutase [Planctomycetota bacterium]
MSESNADLIALVEAAVSSGTIQAETGRLATKWLTEPHFAEFVPAIRADIQAANWEQIEVCFWEEIPFGTGGRRGPMSEYGSATINERTIAESANGLAAYFKSSSGKSKGSAAVSHDSRNRSREFAELTARVFAANGLKVYLFEAIRSTPELSFAVRHLMCDVGVMISASHNPPADNGFKAYWSTGGQVVPPHDKGIVAAVYDSKKIPKANLDEAIAGGQIEIIGEDIDRAYLDALLRISLTDQRELKAIFSPLHGVGETSVFRLFQEAGFDGISIFEPHREPHGDFPNVPNHLPNPENTAVFQPIIEQDAKPNDVGLILASDPDADRIAVCVRCSKTGEYLPVSGNQAGALITDYIIQKRSAARPPIDGAQGNTFTSHLTSDHYIITTLVSTGLAGTIAKANGLKVVDNLLVGFKWIGLAMDEHGPEKFVFGFEESLGYLAGDFARDKDAAVGALYLAELAAELAQDGRTLLDRLDELYSEHGYFNERQRSDYAYGPTGKELITGLMAKLRHEPPAVLGGVTLSRVDDYQAHETRKLPGNSKTEDLPQPQGNLLIFHGEHEDCRIRFAARPSGTEPKIKFYLFAEPHGPAGDDVEGQKSRTNARVDEFEKGLADWVGPLLAAD